MREEPQWRCLGLLLETEYVTLPFCRQRVFVLTFRVWKGAASLVSVGVITDAYLIGVVLAQAREGP